MGMIENHRFERRQRRITKKFSFTRLIDDGFNLLLKFIKSKLITYTRPLQTKIIHSLVHSYKHQPLSRPLKFLVSNNASSLSVRSTING
mmetsp:Transcript_15678/g.17569  ORF Transcript_15678/g.17569 Transcript_15678/m.17569 type:complete len:89 (+) Transcript_15678:826-1092(+)